jgi:hypothetical protein
MNKITAHATLAIADIASLAACYYVYVEWENLKRQILTASDIIRIQDGMGVYVATLIVPVIHMATFFEWQRAAKRWGNRILILFLFLFGFGVFTLGDIFERKLEAVGYRYCFEKSEMMTFSEFKAYVKVGAQCSKSE